MKKILLILFTCISILNTAAQDTHPLQVLANTLGQNDFFNAREQRKIITHSIPEPLDLFYKHKMCYFMNKPDSAAIYLEKILEQYPTFLGGMETKIQYINILLSLWNEVQNYNKVLKTYDIAEKLTCTPDINTTWQKEQITALSHLRNRTKQLDTIPKMTVVKGEKAYYLDITEEPLITSVIEFNNIPMKTWIDTGWRNCIFMTKELADQCNAKEIPSLEDVTMNGVPIRGYWALIDSVKIGGIIFKNVHALVSQNSFSSLAPNSIIPKEAREHYDSIMNTTGVIIGLPLLRRMGSIQIDWNKHKMKIQPAPELKDNLSKANMFILDKELYTNIHINSLSCNGIVDTGATNAFIELSNTFYTKNQNRLSVDKTQEADTVRRGGMARISIVKYKPIICPNITFETKQIDIGNNDIIAWQDETWLGMKDALLGSLFLKSLGSKVTFDFVNMRLSAE